MSQAEAIAKALEKLDHDMDNDPLMQEIEREGTAPAPEGQVYVCGACGKTSPTRYGFDDADRNVADPGWDESCMLNAVLCFAPSIKRSAEGRVTHADPVDSTPVSSATPKEGT